MRHGKARETQASAAPGKTSKPIIGIRLVADKYQRLELLKAASKRSRTSLLAECLDEHLPLLESQYAEQIKRVKAAA